MPKKIKPLQRKEKAVNPKSLANLKKFKPGQSGNPLGGKLHNPLVRALANFTNETYRDILERVMMGHRDDLDHIVEDPNSTNLQVVVAKAFRDAVDTGSFGLVERIAERMLGKAPETLNINQQTNIKAVVATADREDIKRILQEIEDDV